MDVALVGIPRLNIDAPPMGIASIKGSLVRAGYLAKCFDVNINLYHSLDFTEWLEIDNYFQTDLRYTGTSINGAGTRSIEFLDIVAKRRSQLQCRKKYQRFIDQQIDLIMAHSPKWIGISVFSVNSVIPSIDFLSQLKARYPQQKVLAGGMGLSSFGLGGSANFGDFLEASGLIDTYIFGEGEQAIIKLLQASLDSKFSEQIANLDELPFPDYSDFDFKLYPGKENMVYITGSRGCVRSCTFCDIGALWKKYRFRSGESLANEILHGYRQYDTLDFYFTDSLINGNLREFNKLIETVIDYKSRKLLPEELMFGGQWICRPKSRFKEEHYQRMALAGVNNISVGIESGSDAVLSDMRKGTTREDYDFMMEMLDKYGIRLNMLMLIGYPTETENDFQDTLRMIRDYKKYSDSGTVWGVVLGKTMVILPNTPIGDNPLHWGIEYDANGNWVSQSNPSLNYEERIRRRIAAGKLCEELGYVIKSQVVTVNSLYEIVKDGGYDSLG